MSSLLVDWKRLRYRLHRKIITSISCTVIRFVRVSPNDEPIRTSARTRGFSTMSPTAILCVQQFRRRYIMHETAAHALYECFFYQHNPTKIISLGVQKQIWRAHESCTSLRRKRERCDSLGTTAAVGVKTERGKPTR